MTIPSDAPKGSIICPDCGGSGLVAGWAPGPMQTAEDCDKCGCNGWVMDGLNIVVDKFQQTFYIGYGQAYVNGHTSWGGEIFYIFVPPEYRRRGIAKMLLRQAIKLLNDEFSSPTPGITSPTTPEGVGLVKWFKAEIEALQPGEDVL